MTGIHIGTDYPKPVVDMAANAKLSRERLWQLRQQQLVQTESRRIIETHSRR
jgi:hypothetical protein